MKSRKRVILEYTIFGFAFGLSFPILALSLDSYFKLESFDMNQIPLLVSENPIHYIVFSAPIILSIMFYVIGGVIL